MMDDKVVVLTGGTSGIGPAAAAELARRGARIILIARDRARAAFSVASIIAKPGYRLSPWPSRALAVG
jgi:NAD(P)-dependent dehydrogenase (short-subunit alcohol dehydrogenase family)